MNAEQIMNTDKRLRPGGCEMPFPILTNISSLAFYKRLLAFLAFGRKKLHKNKLLGRLFDPSTQLQRPGNANVINIEISLEKMNDLLLQRQICVEDVRCLDVNSKQCLKKLCLKTCLYNTSINTVPTAAKHLHR
jgi:hypothetical protein